ncbi:WD40 repeat domain-containing protein [Flammeovirga kamogawensis]|uniref:WD40 repeat domain-containing protein n=1 Tax=Flammeovirga kamogawensis TaxID=373891 RepID=A0ABX8GWQ3_9BACT|nr:WD40 repeat domain-containing protein [Flammeovirga kamogawensis]MBB6461285.1 WD40 repeat protein [Flammeovirga kamogawensis]QWG07844.1 WD40 repeat domain-containing protein [Flammeovirga kamogawensis]TRX69649.1 WD40 repeat domain-containing protein [Flammeovirga kamogawensis]
MQRLEVEKISNFGGHTEGLYSVVHFNDNGKFYTAGADGFVVEWNIAQADQGRLVAKVPNTVYALCPLIEENQLVVGQNTDGIHLLDLTSGKEIKSLKLTDQAVFSIKRFKNELFIGTGDGWLIVVAIDQWAVTKKVKVSEKSVRSVAIDPKKEIVWTGSSDHLIKGYAIDTLSEVRELLGHENSVFALTVTPDAQFLVSGGRDAHMRIWNLDGFIETQKDIVAHMYTINDIVFRADGKYFVTCSKDKSIKVWRTEDFRLLKVIDKARHAGHGTSINRLAWIGEDIIISVSDDHSAAAWKVAGL